ncbi:hypothetical protein FMEAI12_5210036 [Parafrankia sp. Ea1.12]|nr:hypothetical protein FMEAI12_5210036 [Parafrankia sp. Ea1.12]
MCPRRRTRQYRREAEQHRLPQTYAAFAALRDSTRPGRDRRGILPVHPRIHPIDYGPGRPFWRRPG